MPCRVTADLRAHEEQQDRADRDYEMYKGEALDDLVWRVMENEKGRPFDLYDFLEEQDDLHLLLGNAVIRSSDQGWLDLRDVIEERLRSKLEDSEALEERAAALAQDARDNS